ncbi:hypothetical protein, partial [Rhizobium leguminosarum]|uniref:hypothetical protein n=1 Tax=Rhizobium leguminosarum TaxID=384 RepID=UPI003F951564
RACLKLHPKPKIERNAFLALPSLAAAQDLLSKLRVELAGLLFAARDHAIMQISIAEMNEDERQRARIHNRYRMGRCVEKLL